MPRNRTEDKYYLKQVAATLLVALVIGLINAYADIAVLQAKEQNTKEILKEIRADVRYIRENM